MINKKSVLQNLNDIAFPRLSGTKAEERASKIIKGKILDLGLTPEIQKFTFSTFYPRIYKKIAFFLISWLLIVFYVYINLLFVLINILILTCIFFTIVTFTRHPEKISLGKTFRSENIYVKVEPKDVSLNNDRERFKNPFRFLLFCHKDTKSQKLTITFRSINSRLWIYSLIICIVMLILKYIFISTVWFNILTACMIGLNWNNTLLIIINTTDNRSPGAIDNGSGVAIILELLHYFSKREHKLHNLELWFVFTGAEENGTMGIRNFYQIIKDFNKERVRILNFDSIAAHLDVFASVEKRIKNKPFFQLLSKHLTRLNPTYHVKPYILPVTRSDGYYLNKKDFLGIGFADKKSYKYIHSPQDSVDKVKPQFLASFCKAIATFLQEYDNYRKREDKSKI